MIKNGECTEVSFKLSKKELDYYVDRKLIVEKGKYDIYMSAVHLMPIIILLLK